MNDDSNATPRTNAARRSAYTMIFIWMVGAGLAASLTIAGRPQLSLAICGGALLLSVVVLVVGALAVGSTTDGER